MSSVILSIGGGGPSSSRRGPNTKQTVGSTAATSIAMPCCATTGSFSVQVTKEHLTNPRRVVLRVDKALRPQRFDGPAPVFEQRWRQLFGSLYSAVGPRDHQRVAG